MGKIPDLGRDVDAYCGRCKLVLAHTVTARTADRLVRVMCNTCKAEHGYRPAPGEAAPRRRAEAQPTRQPKTRAVASNFHQLLGARSVETARPYSPKASLELSEIIAHPSFGVGVVSALKNGGKVEVVFPDGVRVLVHQRG